MPPKTSGTTVRYFVIPFGKKRGGIAAGQPQEARDRHQAMTMAKMKAATPPNCGAVGVKRTSGSPEDEEGTFGVISTMGEVNLEGLFE